MFEQATLSNANAGRRAWTTGLGFAGETMLVGFLALVPMIWPEAMPKAQTLLMLLTPPAPEPPPIHAAVTPHATHAPTTPLRFTMPAAIPAAIAMVVDDPPEDVGVVSGGVHSTGDAGGLLTTILNTHGVPPPPPTAGTRVVPQPTVQPTEPRRIRTSSLELARLIHRVEPVYPQMAKTIHVQGTVELTGVIATDGHIRELKALSGNPLLIGAAIDAVRQWIYAPPVLNGERVEVIAPITVNFRLDR